MCLITVFLLGSGFLFGSGSILSFNKWNDDLTKVNLEEGSFESDADADADDDYSFLGKYSKGLKKIEQKHLKAFSVIVHRLIYDVVFNARHDSFGLNSLHTRCNVALWLRYRHLLI